MFSKLNKILLKILKVTTNLPPHTAQCKVLFDSFLIYRNSIFRHQISNSWSVEVYHAPFSSWRLNFKWHSSSWQLSASSAEAFKKNAESSYTAPTSLDGMDVTPWGTLKNFSLSSTCIIEPQEQLSKPLRIPVKRLKITHLHIDDHHCQPFLQDPWRRFKVKDDHVSSGRLGTHTHFQHHSEVMTWLAG